MKRNICSLALAVALAWINSATAGVIHVPGDRSTIQAGINAAIDGDTVLVAAGIYAEHLTVLNKSVVVASTDGPSVTTLTSTGGDNVDPEGVQTLDGFQLIGFTVSVAAGGRGFVTNGSVFLLDNCVFHGAANAYIHYSHANSAGTIRNCRFGQNAHPSASIGILMDNFAGLTLTRCLFLNCATGVQIAPLCPASIINNTLDGCGVGIYVDNATVTVENNIIANGSSIGIRGLYQKLDYNDIWNNAQNYTSGAQAGAHDISSDPMFINLIGEDYGLSGNSPCIDAGDPAPQFVDPDGSHSDMGAFPFSGNLVYPVAINMNLTPESPFHVVNHTPSFHWTFSSPAGSQTAFELEVGTDLEWDVAEIWSTGVVTSTALWATYAGANLDDGATYYWRLRLYDEENPAGGSWRVSQFRMNSKPSVPVPNAPVAQALVDIMKVRLFLNNSTDAEGDKRRYDFELYEDGGLNTLVGRQDGIAETTGPTTGSSPFPQLVNSHPYWWRARANDGYEYSEWSAAAEFRTSTGWIRVPSEQPTIQAAINVAGDGDTILVAAGTYHENLTCSSKSLVIRSSDGAGSTTLISSTTGDNVHPEGAQTFGGFQLVGFTVSVGSGGRGFATNGSRFVLDDCIFEGPARAYVHYSSSNSIGTIRNCRFGHIQQSADIGILMDNYATLTLTRCLIVKAGTGVKIASSTTATVVNNTLDRCNGGMQIIGATVTAENNIISNGSSYGVSGLFQKLDYNDIWNNVTNYTNLASPGAHDISADPRFVDAPQGDYRLLSSSPCVDAGDPAIQYNDADGSRNDIGAFPANVCSGSPRAKDLNLGTELRTHVVTHTPRFYWTFCQTTGAQGAFELQVGTDTLWDVAEMWATGQVSSADTFVVYAGAAFTDGAIYHWRVRVFDGVASAWGEWASSDFRMNSLPSVPIPAAPIDRARAGITGLRLFVENSSDAESDPLTYDFEIYEDSGLGSIFSSQSGIVQTSDPTASNTFPPLLDRHEYWWRARARDGFENSPWSTAEPFVTQIMTIRVPADQPTIQAAINAAFDADSILVAPAIYHEHIDFLGKAIVVAAAAGPDSTIIAPPSSWTSVVTFHDGEGRASVLMGFTIKGGSADYGGAVKCAGTSPSIIHNRFIQNTSSWMGGAIGVYGGGSPLIEENEFYENSSNYGGGFWSVSASGTLRHNVFGANSAQVGGAVGGDATSGVIDLEYNLVYGSSGSGGAVRFSGPAVLANNTIVDNPAGGFYCSNELTAKNNIVAANSGDGIVTTGSSIILDYNDSWSNGTDYSGTAVPGPHDISLDPRFSDASQRVYQLLPGSPCINAGDPAPEYNDPDGSRNDIGAFPASASTVCPIPRNRSLGAESLIHVVSHTPTFYWSFYDTIGTQAGYELQVGTDTLWDVAELWATGTVAIADTFALYAGTGLIDGTFYYWRLRLYNGTTSTWGDWRWSQFRMNSEPSVPIPQWPLGGAGICPDRVRLFVNNSVDPEADPVTYDFQVFDSPSLSTLIASETGVTETVSPTGSSTFPSLINGADYWWRTRAHDGFEYSDWSSPETFQGRPGLLRVPTDQPTIALAVTEACTGDTILLAHGTYNEKINPLGKAIVIAGALPAESTIVRGDVGGAVVTVASGEGPGTIIRDLTIMGFQGAVKCIGIRIEASSPQILDNIITSNIATSGGGGILVVSGNPLVRGNRILRNSATYEGGGIYVDYGASAIVDSNLFQGNAALRGSGLYTAGKGNLTLTRNIFYANSVSESGGTVYLTRGFNNETMSFIVDHNTFVGNLSSPATGGAISVYNPDGGEITNNIIAFNMGSCGLYVSAGSGSLPNVSFNDLWWNESGAYSGVGPGLGSIVAAPRFCDTSHQDFHLASTSPCLGSGIDGEDMGAVGEGCPDGVPIKPILPGGTIDYPRSSERVVNHTPLIAWGYHDPGSRPLQQSEVQVGTDNDWSAAEMWQAPSVPGPDTVIQYAGAPLLDGTRYYVRIRVRNDTLWSDWSETSFHMNNPPPVPILEDPSSGSTIFSGRPEFIVFGAIDLDGDPISSNFEFYTDSNLTHLVYSATAPYGRSWYPDSLTAENQRHWWRVRFSDGLEFGGWSPVRWFWLNAYPEPPSAFHLRLPVNGGAVYDNYPSLEWDVPVDPDPASSYMYVVTISLNPSFSFKQEVFSMTEGLTWPDALVSQATYWWKVRATGISGDTITSEVRSFKLAQLGDLTGDGVVDVLDVLFLISYTFAGGTPPYALSVADVNADCRIDVFDVMYMINHVFSNGPAPKPGCVAPKALGVSKSGRKALQ